MGRREAAEGAARRVPAALNRREVAEAVKRSRAVCTIERGEYHNSYRVCSPTSRSCIDALEDMVKALHPG